MTDITMISNLTSDDSFNLFYLLLLLVLLGSGAIVRFRDRQFPFFKSLLIWIVILFGLVLIYSYRHDFNGVKNRIIGELNPSMAIENSGGSISFRKGGDGHYHVNARVNGKDVEFLVDTGATDVVMSRKTAAYLGIDVKKLNFNKIYNTANGIVKGAPVTLDYIEIGSVRMNNVGASVNDADLNKPLLGMSFLNRLGGYEVKNDVLTIWP